MKKRLFIVIFSTVFILLFSYVFINFINIGCIYRKYFGFYCAGCGITRMIKSICSLEFYQAFRYNPLVFILLIVLLPYVIYSLVYYVLYGNFKISKALFIVLVVLLLGYTILRNIDCFSFLIPTKV